jgi:hypothetical protein
MFEFIGGSGVAALSLCCFLAGWAMALIRPLVSDDSFTQPTLSRCRACNIPIGPHCRACRNNETRKTLKLHVHETEPAA